MRAYLDYNATSPIRPAAREALLAALEQAGNASSPALEGQHARHLVEQARRAVAGLLGAAPREIVFTSGGTEALNLALQGHLLAIAEARDEIVVSAIEHAAVRACAEAMGQRGIRLREVPVDGHGQVRLDALAAAVGPRTALVAVMLANNETGVLQPVGEAARIAHAAGALLLVDAVQAAGRVPVHLRALGADFLAVSAHKLGGAPGAGALAVRQGVPLAPLLHGGGQEQGRRSGSENVPAIAAFGAAAQAAGERLAGEAERVRGLRDRLEAELLAALPSARVNGRAAARVPGTISLTVPGLDAEALVIRLDLNGVAASTGAACSSGAAEPSRVLAAMGLPPAEQRATLRLSLGHLSTAREIDLARDEVIHGVTAQRGRSRPARTAP